MFISGTILHALAKDVLQAMKIKKFEAISSWQFRFRDRHDIVQKFFFCRRIKYQCIVKIISLLLYQLQPRARPHHSNESRKLKKSKARISVFFCCNATGTEKLKPFQTLQSCFGKSARFVTFKMRKCFHIIIKIIVAPVRLKKTLLSSLGV